MEQYKVRRLKTRDFFRVATIISKMTKTSLASTGDILTTDSGIGFSFINSALQHAETDVKSWLADLVQMDLKEFDELPFDAPFEIVEQLAEQEDLSRFFTRVKGLAKNNKLLQ